MYIRISLLDFARLRSKADYDRKTDAFPSISDHSKPHTHTHTYTTLSPTAVWLKGRYRFLLLISDGQTRTVCTNWLIYMYMYLLYLLPLLFLSVILFHQCLILLINLHQCSQVVLCRACPPGPPITLHNSTTQHTGMVWYIYTCIYTCICTCTCTCICVSSYMYVLGCSSSTG